MWRLLCNQEIDSNTARQHYYAKSAWRTTCQLRHIEVLQQLFCPVAVTLESTTLSVPARHPPHYHRAHSTPASRPCHLEIVTSLTTHGLPTSCGAAERQRAPSLSRAGRLSVQKSVAKRAVAESDA